MLPKTSRLLQFCEDGTLTSLMCHKTRNGTSQDMTLRYQVRKFINFECGISPLSLIQCHFSLVIFDVIDTYIKL